MISPDMYGRMLATDEDSVMEMADPTQAAMDSMSDADRLEAAVDAGLLMCARDRDELDEGVLNFSLELQHLRSWVGPSRDSSWYRWDWTKDKIVRLFLTEVAGRYVAGGWARCVTGYREPQSQCVWFEFESHPGPDVRTVSALDDIGEVLGIEGRPGQPGDRCYRKSLADYLESLLVRARMMRFNLDAAMREAGVPTPDDEGDISLD